MTNNYNKHYLMSNPYCNNIYINPYCYSCNNCNNLYYNPHYSCCHQCNDPCHGYNDFSFSLVANGTLSGYGLVTFNLHPLPQFSSVAFTAFEPRTLTSSNNTTNQKILTTYTIPLGQNCRKILTLSTNVILQTNILSTNGIINANTDLGSASIILTVKSASGTISNSGSTNIKNGISDIANGQTDIVTTAVSTSLNASVCGNIIINLVVQVRNNITSSSVELTPNIINNQLTNFLGSISMC